MKKQKTLLVTGASAGFGQAVAQRFLARGDKVIVCARRSEKLNALYGNAENAYILPLDLSNTAAILPAIASLPAAFSSVDVLVNNAGLALGLSAAQETQLIDWQKMVETNILGLIAITHALLPQMVARNRGYIINLGSTAGTYPYFGSNVYGASKAFVKQFSQNLRTDLLGTGVHVSNIEPGLCGGTEFSVTRFKGDVETAAAVYENVVALNAEDIADTIEWIVDRPAHVNINRIELMPVAQASAGLAVSREVVLDD